MANLTGGAANDTIIGANAISDTLNGAAGNDLLFGYGSVSGGFSPPLLVPGLDPNGGGATDNDKFAGGLGNDTVQAGGGNDTADGGDDDDALFGDNGNDSLAGGLGADVLAGGLGNDTADGGAGGDNLTGGDGNDRLDGGLGADTMNGGDQDDVYIVDDLGDKASEGFADALGGTDFVLSSVTHALGTGIEHLTLTGAAASKGTGNALGNFIFGNAAGNELVGLAGNDTLDGGAGADSMEGGADNDIYVIDNAGDNITEAAPDGIDTIRWNLATNLALASFANIENATLLGMAAVNLTGTAGDNVLEGNTGANKIDGGGGSDTMAGGAGNDTYSVDDAGDRAIEGLAGAAGGIDSVVSSVFTFTLGDNIENLTLTGSAFQGAGNGGKNVITGNDGANDLYGAAIGEDGVSDTLIGGKGDDRYIIGTGDVVIETLDDSLVGGIDTVRWFGSGAYTLGANLENLELVGSGTNGIGNALANKITGNDGANILDGKAGADTMDGQDGNDIYMVDNAGDKVTDSGTGNDEVRSAVALAAAFAGVENYLFTGAGPVNFAGNELANKITGTAGADTLTGDARSAPTSGSDTLIGGAGNDQLTDLNFVGPDDDDSDRLDGGTGADTMNGGDGDDVYIVDNVKDVADEPADDGEAGLHDRVESSVTYTLNERIEDLTLTGAAAINGTGSVDANILIGNTGANKLSGLGGDDSLDGGGGNDTLDGGTGADTMAGGAGNDTYVVDDTGDKAIENVAGAAGGIDTVVSSVNSLTLGDNMENLTLTGSAFQGAGNTGKNVITGNDGANDLYGAPIIQDGANDTLIGGKGDDRYAVGTGDVVIETLADSLVGGIDRVSWFGVGAYTLGANLENLELVFAGAGTGNALANEITGSDGNDILDGKAGADTMDGKGGDDLLFVDNIGDKTGDSGGGTDEVRSSVTHSIGDGIDILTLTGAAAINGTGNDGSNVITGNSGANSLSGGLGDDTLAGGAGNDSLSGGDGSDDFVFGPAPGKDTVTNFNFTDTGAGLDQIDIADLLVGYIDGVSNVFDFVQILVGGSSTTIKVDANGLVGGSSFTDVAVINVVVPEAITVQDIIDDNIILTHP